MLSIIISTYQPQFYSALEKNIAETIGIPYEIIKIDNPNLMGICEAYNKGASLSKYDYLLFVHEDVIFHTKEWGQKLINHLKLENVGVIGVAGSNYVPKAPIGWYLPDNSYNFLNYIQNDKNKSNPRLFSNINSKQTVYALDGVFIAIKKNRYSEFLFDENIKGFHGYDTDFSLRLATIYDNFVIHDIIIEHFSVGSTDNQWLSNNIIIKRKNIHFFKQVYNNELEKLSFQAFLNNYFSFNDKNIKNLIYSFQFISPKLLVNSFFPIMKTYLYYIMKAI